MNKAASEDVLCIGITVRKGTPEWIEENSRHYLNVLAAYGATAVVLSPDQPATLPDGQRFAPDATGRLPDAILDHLDGLILSGGGDVHPRYFNQPLNGAEPEQIDLARDELELNLARGALGRDLPIFGICRGCQVLNVAAGGAMRQHLDGHRSPKEDPVFHPVAIQAGTRLHALVGRNEIQVNTYHHQGVDHESLAPIFVPAGVALPDTWLVEAFESPVHGWVLGVQWHPERLFELSDDHRRLWEGFLQACRQTARRREVRNPEAKLKQ